MLPGVRVIVQAADLVQKHAQGDQPGIRERGVVLRQRVVETQLATLHQLQH